VADRVSGHGLRYQCCVGFSSEERSEPQTVCIDFDARTDWRESGRADRPIEIVDYAKVDKAIGKHLASREWRLIEAIAESAARIICVGFPVDQVRVTVTKYPSDMPHCSGVSVSCSRTPADFID
jgi:FolB domain-containing protein